MSKLEIGTKVKVGNTDVIGTITSVGHSDYQVEHTDASGHLVRRSFIAEELTVVEGGEGDTAKGESSTAGLAAVSEDTKTPPAADTTGGAGDKVEPEKVDTDGKKTDLQTGEETDNNGGVKDVSGAGEPNKDEIVLVGSSKQPSTFELADGTTRQLGEVVRQAFEDSGLSAADWNALPDEEREAQIELEVECLD